MRRSHYKICLIQGLNSPIIQIIIISPRDGSPIRVVIGVLGERIERNSIMRPNKGLQ